MHLLKRLGAWTTLGWVCVLAAGCGDEGQPPNPTPALSTDTPPGIVDPTPTGPTGTAAATPTEAPASPTPTHAGDTPTATPTAAGPTPTHAAATPTRPGPTPTDASTPTRPPAPTPTDTPTPTRAATPGAPTPTPGAPTPTPGAPRVDADGDGYTVEEGDCDDTRADVSPGDPEIPYDGIDNNCAGGDLTDVDEDGVDGGPLGDDCDDGDDGAYPGADEIPYDGIDQDCQAGDLTDVDGDGYDAEEAGGDDCDDGDVNTHPGADEFDDDADNDCDGSIDEDLPTTDADGDGFSPASGDCNDGNVSVFPGATDTPYDGIDQDCSGADETDLDDDGYAGGPAGNDCDDDDPGVNPGVSEVCNGVDDDCDLAVDDGVLTTYYQDLDEDQYGNPGKASTTCVQPAGYVTDKTDCKDTNDQVHPGATEYCNGVDDDCDTVVDDGVSTTYYRDLDGDRYGDPTSSRQACSAQTGYVLNNTDCDDTKAAVNPGATELCDGIDNNCDTRVDEGVITTYHQDLDGDTYGNPSKPLASCTPPAGYVIDKTDCKDTNDQVHPGAAEFCNGVDDDCDGNVDDGATITYYQDVDRDGFGNPNTATQACAPPSGYVLNGNDCDDTKNLVNPNGVETCNLLDDDCDTQIDEGVKSTFYADTDGDGFGNPASPKQACTAGTGYVANNTDCNDTAASAHPGGTEVCNGIDDDCDTVIDEGVKTTFYSDGDGDGFGNPNLTTSACAAPAHYVAAGTDCNDSVATVYPGAPEQCNSVDDNCNTVIDDRDVDGDGHRPTACGGGDCDDTEETTHPGAVDVCDDGVDNDCSGRENFCYDSASFDGAKFN